MQIRGIKRGQIIELTEELIIPDGQEIVIEINLPKRPTSEDRWQQLYKLIGAWSDQPNLDTSLDAGDPD
ncbi:hypothetical protein [Laspinema olomoucense]|uniref:hypothetical protein n=1 Tax=Laspinema olomoucense TaxID=3231600 RepID=UPI0021BB53BB|nr:MULTISPECIES: hypothetical protein [unclassified Laspinema]MCT7973664.1 hypothetical protein [Laspinema sp. D3d]MCT7996258.1 hypothetical protein [Laspinema sp. D3c]